MRVIVATLVLTIGTVAGQAGDKGKTVPRYGIDLDTKTFPQSTPKETLGSVLKAIGDKKFDYLLAHLADPGFVEPRVAANKKGMGADLTEAQKTSLAFDRLVQTVADDFLRDPTKLKELQRFFKDGEWEDDGKDAVATLKGVQATKVFMKRIPPDRWVLLDREK